MSEHYYAKNPSVESAERKWSFELRGHKLHFASDSGVFSKREVDFGSKLLIETFSFPEQAGDLLDVGCGYGPIGLTLAKEDESRMVHMIDVNERALALAKKNGEENRIANCLVYESDGFSRVEKRDFAAIVTNPPIRAGKKIVHLIFEQAVQHLQPGGELWVVIQKKQGAPSALEKLETLFAQVDVVEKKKGYFIIKAKKV
ncbi:class I SAM-dependent methyltransferase [Halalkalibacter oceani]|uniref:class I SAM-dependent methyltransferase n=1 Tax=Halalkalibacter oceani TaxID=1653776 RepID=UPI003398B9EF